MLPRNVLEMSVFSFDADVDPMDTWCADATEKMVVILGAGRLNPKLLLAVEMAWVSCMAVMLVAPVRSVGVALISKVISTGERRVESKAEDVPEHPGLNV